MKKHKWKKRFFHFVNHQIQLNFFTSDQRRHNSIEKTNQILDKANNAIKEASEEKLLSEKEALTQQELTIKSKEKELETKSLYLLEQEKKNKAELDIAA